MATLLGTATTTNGSESVPFSQAQTLALNTPLVFSGQPSATYYLAAAMNGATSGTLTANFTGTGGAGQAVTAPRQWTILSQQVSGSSINVRVAFWVISPPGNVQPNPNASTAIPNSGAAAVTIAELALLESGLVVEQVQTLALSSQQSGGAAQTAASIEALVAAAWPGVQSTYAALATGLTGLVGAIGAGGALVQSGV